jgi:hypothetical protein
VRKALALVIGLALVVAAVAASAQAGPSKSDGMYGIKIVNYKVNPDKTVTINVKIRGWKMAPKLVGKKKNTPGSGHWHIYVNGKYNNLSANATVGKTMKLKKGDYKVYVELANNDHSSLTEKTVSKTIPVMVDA